MASGAPEAEAEGEAPQVEGDPVTLGGVFEDTQISPTDSMAILNGINFCVGLVNEHGGLRLGPDGAERRDLSMTALSADISGIEEPLCISPEEADSGIPVATLVQQRIVEVGYAKLVEMGTDALMGPYSSTLTLNASAAADEAGPALFYGTAAAAASLFNRGIDSFYGTLVRVPDPPPRAAPGAAAGAPSRRARGS